MTTIDVDPLIADLTTGDYGPAGSPQWGKAGVISVVTEEQWAYARQFRTTAFKLDVERMCYFCRPWDDGQLVWLSEDEQLLMRELSDDEIREVVKVTMRPLCSYRVVYHRPDGKTRRAWPVSTTDDTERGMSALLDKLVQSEAATGGDVEVNVDGIGWVLCCDCCG